uniref:Uncharacterized protein n=1 Tax=Parascaris equorum TaxID=6256 RepID=A0A914RTD6_PAREQ
LSSTRGIFSHITYNPSDIEQSYQDYVDIIGCLERSTGKLARLVCGVHNTEETTVSQAMSQSEDRKEEINEECSLRRIIFFSISISTLATLTAIIAV